MNGYIILVVIPGSNPLAVAPWYSSFEFGVSGGSFFLEIASLVVALYGKDCSLVK